jgi:hypothetical protein
MPGHGDWLVCGISTQLAQRIHGFDELLDIHDPDYETSGVVHPSLTAILSALLALTTATAQHNR